jgi:hypothetical protein
VETYSTQVIGFLNLMIVWVLARGFGVSTEGTIPIAYGGGSGILGRLLQNQT